MSEQEKYGLKNSLFSHILKENWDENAKKIQIQTKERFESDKSEWTEEKITNYAKMGNQQMSQWSEEQESWVDKCKTTIVIAEGSEYGLEGNVEIYVHRPRNFNNEKKKALIQFYGGGFIMNSAKISQPQACRLAAIHDMVVFNVNEGNCPKVKAREMINNGYIGYKQALANIEKYDIDEKRIGLYGSSQGGHMVVGVAMELAKNNESNTIKVAIGDICAIWDSWIYHSDENKLLQDFNVWAIKGNIGIYKAMTNDWENEKKISIIISCING